MRRAIGPSPARATPHDATAWLPVPDPGALPSLEALIDADTRADGVGAVPAAGAREVTIDLVALEALVSPTPARAAPHDAAAWLPLPGDVSRFPDLGEMLDPAPEVRAASEAELAAATAGVVAAAEAAVAPSPARAEPHDASTWLPLPDPELLVPLTELSPADDGAASHPHGWRRVAAAAWRPRSAFLVLLVCATAFVVIRPGTDGAPPTAAGVAPFNVTVDLDGQIESVTTTARSAAAVAAQLGVDKLVAVREAPRRLSDGDRVVLRTRRAGLLSVDGQTFAFDSPSHTVGELIVKYDIALDGDDTTFPSPDSVLVDGAKVQVVRVGAATRRTEEQLAFAETEVPDPDLPIGERRVLVAGEAGIAVVTWRARMENGVEVGRTVLSKVPRVAPVDQVVGYGTQADWHWDALANCESGSRWGTVDGGTPAYDGGLGILRENWIHYGGLEFAPNAGLATREEQIIVGMRIYDDHGWDAWGCANGVLGWD